MKIIEIAPLYNGAHRNTTYNEQLNIIPDGWAVLPEDMKCENFPFGKVEAEEVDGLMTVTKWVAGELPESEPIPEPEAEPTVWDELDAAYLEGVNHAYE